VNIPNEFASLKDAARYVIRTHIAVRLMYPDRPNNGTELAGYLMAQSLLSVAEIAQIRAEEEQRRHVALMDHALGVVYG